jgi:hypothetical protein
LKMYVNCTVNCSKRQESSLSRRTRPNGCDGYSGSIRSAIQTFDFLRPDSLEDILFKDTMKDRWSITVVAFLTAGAVQGADLSRIDRTIRKEPSYSNKPCYCLLAFGAEARTCIWLVQDGDKIYVDRNANRDLTERGEMIQSNPTRELNSSYKDRKYEVGALTPDDKTGPHADFEISAYSENNGPWNYVLKLKVNGKIQQFAGWRPIFKDSPKEAAVLHFGGPIVVQPLRYQTFSLSEKKPELHIRFATPGLGEFSMVSLGYEAIPQSVEPVALIKWPGTDEISHVKLLSRC